VSLDRTQRAARSQCRALTALSPLRTPGIPGARLARAGDCHHGRRCPRWQYVCTAGGTPRIRVSDMVVRGDLPRQGRRLDWLHLHEGCSSWRDNVRSTSSPKDGVITVKYAFDVLFDATYSVILPAMLWYSSFTCLLRAPDLIPRSPRESSLHRRPSSALVHSGISDAVGTLDTALTNRAFALLSGADVGGIEEPHVLSSCVGHRFDDRSAHAGGASVPSTSGTYGNDDLTLPTVILTTCPVEQSRLHVTRSPLPTASCGRNRAPIGESTELKSRTPL
jgi:hypothetical protein